MLVVRLAILAGAWCAVVMLSAVGAQARLIAVRFGTLVTGTGEVISDAVVVVEGDHITAVGRGDKAVPTAAEVLDLRPYTGIPGLIDAHTHITYYWSGAPGTGPRNQPQRNPAVTVVLSQENGMKALEAGVTTQIGRAHV